LFFRSQLRATYARQKKANDLPPCQYRERQTTELYRSAEARSLKQEISMTSFTDLLQLLLYLLFPGTDVCM
jgi:hypothetical protein